METTFAVVLATVIVVGSVAAEVVHFCSTVRPYSAGIIEVNEGIRRDDDNPDSEDSVVIGAGIVVTVVVVISTNLSLVLVARFGLGLVSAAIESA